MIYPIIEEVTMTHLKSVDPKSHPLGSQRIIRTLFIAGAGFHLKR